jgi:hypothetical protein
MEAKDIESAELGLFFPAECFPVLLLLYFLFSRQQQLQWMVFVHAHQPV